MSGNEAGWEESAVALTSADLYRLYDARISRQIHALHESATGIAVVLACGYNLWPDDPRFAQFYARVSQQGAKLATVAQAS